MTQRERGKDKALRIDLTYYRRRTWLGLGRNIATATALIVTIFYGLWMFSLDRRGDRIGSGARSSQLSTGPLAEVHASFENDCQQCHSEQMGVALSRDAWQANAESRLNLVESKCQNCHEVDPHAYGRLKNPRMDRDCIACHHDHLGRDNDLSIVSNAVCAECHADLETARIPGTNSPLTTSIGDFSVQSHGVVRPHTLGTAADDNAKIQFRSLMEDRGRVRFDHAQHLRPGQVDPDSKGGFQLGMMAAELRAVYAIPGQDESSLVQLDCASCHQIYAIDEPNHASASVREEGRHYAPINFDKHCAACHQMSYAGQEADHLPLPHVAQREEFAQLLAAKQISGRQVGQVSMPADASFPLDKATNSNLAGSEIERQQARNDASVNAIFTRCQQCHAEADTKPDVIASALAGTLAPLIPPRRLQHGLFDHAAHARIDRCVYCHTMPTTVGEPNDHRSVMIDGPEKCTPCHRPIDQPAPKALVEEAIRRKLLGNQPQPTWASANCTLCHRYHWSRDTAGLGQASP